MSNLITIADNVIDLKCLEHVSRIILDSGGCYFYTYQVNGYVYNSDSSDYYDIVEQDRKQLIESWEKLQ